MVTLEQVKRVKAEYEEELMKKSGVVGVAIGHKHINGGKTKQLCIICYVIEKKRIGELEEHDIIPEEIEGVPIDVVESGTIRAL
ncbi:MAG: hypothetical protein AM325_014890 [Candidatus Thorarchaeota archaeon SMTZ1-45]|nr:MAG: hypothetical protein AM325_16260 [Candidatus Thorarchaeota archaeon SMTZ1-45]